MQVHSVGQLLPRLAPRILPSRHLLELGCLRQQLAAATPQVRQRCLAELQRRAPDLTSCATCGCAGAAAVDGVLGGESASARESSAPDSKAHGSGPAALQFQAFWTVRVPERTCSLESTAFCCPTCAACINLGAFLQFIALRSESDSGCASLCTRPRAAESIFGL